jgi:hypothetical protein
MGRFLELAMPYMSPFPPNARFFSPTAIFTIAASSSSESPRRRASRKLTSSFPNKHTCASSVRIRQFARDKQATLVHAQYVYLDVAVSGYSQPVARAAEVLAHRRDKAHLWRHQAITRHIGKHTNTPTHNLQAEHEAQAARPHTARAPQVLTQDRGHIARGHSMFTWPTKPGTP